MSAGTGERAGADWEPPHPGQQRHHLIKLYNELNQYLDNFMATIKRSGFTADVTDGFVESMLDHEVRLLEVMMGDEPSSTSYGGREGDAHSS